MDASNITLPPNVAAALEALVKQVSHAEPVVRYYQAKARFDADPQAGVLLARLSTGQAELRTRQTRDRVAQAKMQELRALQREVQSNRVIMDYSETQQVAMAYLPEVNLEISQLLGVDFASLAGPASC
jgi:cell fate (sporulation/competence/biofilm development) regulator YlbF (YheA/YmcA/DUF963 family)